MGVLAYSQQFHNGGQGVCGTGKRWRWRKCKTLAHQPSCQLYTECSDYADKHAYVCTGRWISTSCV